MRGIALVFSGSITRLLKARLQRFAAAVRSRPGATGAGSAKSSIRSTSVQAASAAAVAQSPRLDLADQWNKLAGVLSTAIEGVGSVREMQAAATQQLDLAQYGIITLVDELAAVMNLPGRQARPATVHAFAAHADYPARKPASGRALAA